MLSIAGPLDTPSAAVSTAFLPSAHCKHFHPHDGIFSAWCRLRDVGFDDFTVQPTASSSHGAAFVMLASLAWFLSISPFISEPVC